MKLEDLEVYQLAREVSKDGWDIYENLDWQTKKVIGDQCITAVDSIGANIAEGFGRFHYLDKNKFNYNARGSLFESKHWTELLVERCKLDPKTGKALMEKLDSLCLKLNGYIAVTRKQVNK